MQAHVTTAVARRAILTVITVFALLGGCKTSPAPAPAPAPVLAPEAGGMGAQVQSASTPADTPLKALQAAFRKSYDEARDRVEASLSPLVVVRFSDMYLVKDGKIVAEAKGIPQKYHLLHRTAHVPLATTNKLMPFLGAALPENVKADLSAYRRLVHAAIPDLPHYGFDAD